MTISKASLKRSSISHDRRADSTVKRPLNSCRTTSQRYTDIIWRSHKRQRPYGRCLSDESPGKKWLHSHSIINKPPEPAWLRGFVVIAMEPYRHFYRQSRRAFADAGDRSICGATALAAPSSISPHIIRTLPSRRVRTCRRRIRGRGVTRLQSQLRQSRLPS